MLTIEKPGLLTTVQDLGRYGYQKYGVITSGAMDQLAHRIANMLVGNKENAATLEVTLAGPVITFNESALISICGGDLSPAIDGKAIQTWRTTFVEKGGVLSFGSCKHGCRAYIAVAGGFSVSKIMGSTSTYLRAEIGGFHGRALKSGNRLSVGRYSDLSSSMYRDLSGQAAGGSFVEMTWSIAWDVIPNYQTPAAIRVIKGREFHLFTKESQESLFEKPFEITPQSDRMGYRLKGKTLSLEQAEQMLSEAVAYGTIQVPTEGDPIVLLADRQTTGGYPKIGQIASVDFPLIAQAKPGEELYFTEVSHQEAQLLFLETEKKIQQLKTGIALKFK